MPMPSFYTINSYTGNVLYNCQPLATFWQFCHSTPLTVRNFDFFGKNFTFDQSGPDSICVQILHYHITLTVPVKFNFSRKKSATKFLCVKTSSDKVVATSFPYPTVHRSIAGDVPIYLKLTHPFKNADFDSFRLTVLQPWQLARILSAIEI